MAALRDEMRPLMFSRHTDIASDAKLCSSADPLHNDAKNEDDDDDNGDDMRMLQDRHHLEREYPHHGHSHHHRRHHQTAQQAVQQQRKRLQQERDRRRRGMRERIMQNSATSPCPLVLADSHSLVSVTSPFYGDISFDEERGLAGRKNDGRQSRMRRLSHQMPFRYSSFRTMKKSASGDENLNGQNFADFPGPARDGARISDNSNTPADAYRPDHVRFCLSVAATTGLLFAVDHIQIKFAAVSDSLPDAWQLMFVQSAIQLFAMLVTVVCFRSNPIPSGGSVAADRWRLLSLSLLNGLCLVATSVAVRRLPLYHSTAIIFSATPALTLLLSALLTGERCGVFRCANVLLIGLGGLILSHPSFLFPHQAAAVAPETNTTTTNNITSSFAAAISDYTAGASDDPLALAAAALVPLLTALLIIVMRQTVVGGVYPVVLVFWLSVGGFIFSLLGLFGFHFNIDGPRDNDIIQWRQSTEQTGLWVGWNAQAWLAAPLSALLGIVVPLFLSFALRWMGPGRLMILRATNILFFFLLKVFFLL
jgi:drug/metabolite transporter (DMT)-like permease